MKFRAWALLLGRAAPAVELLSAGNLAKKFAVLLRLVLNIPGYRVDARRTRRERGSYFAVISTRCFHFHFVSLLMLFERNRSIGRERKSGKITKG